MYYELINGFHVKCYDALILAHGTPVHQYFAPDATVVDLQAEE